MTYSQRSALPTGYPIPEAKKRLAHCAGSVTSPGATNILPKRTFSRFTRPEMSQNSLLIWILAPAASVLATH